MNIKVIALVSVAMLALGGLLFHQIKQNGILEQAKAQAEQSLQDEIDASAKRLAKAVQTDKQLEETQVKYNQLNRYARGLANDLRSQIDECTNTSIPSAVIDRVLEYRAIGKSGTGS